MEKFQKPALSGVLKHNARVWEGRGFTREHIDNSKLSLDWCPGIERPDPEAFVSSRIESIGLKRKPRENAVRMVEWVLTMPEEETDQKAFFRAAYKALEKEYGSDNVIGAWVHCDEPGARPHMHFDFVPVTQDGRLSAKSLMDRSHLRQIHPRIQQEVSAELGHEVHLLLPEEERGRKQLSRLGIEEYKAAVNTLGKAEQDAARASERAAEATKAADMAETAQKAAESRRRAAEASQVDAQAKLRGLMDSVAKKQTQAADLDSEIARKMDQKTSLQAEISRFSEKRENAEAETARLKQETAFARIELDNVRNDLEQDKAEIRMVEGMSYRDADGNTRLGIKGMERAYIESQERMKAAKEQEKAYAAQAAQAKADAKAWQAQADMQQRRLGMKPLKFVSTLRTVCIQIAEDCLELWRYAKDAARRRWNRWMDKGLGDCADTFGVTYIEAVETAEQALHKTAVAQHLEQAEKDLLRGPEDGQEIGIYQQR